MLEISARPLTSIPQQRYYQVQLICDDNNDPCPCETDVPHDHLLILHPDITTTTHAFRSDDVAVGNAGGRVDEYHFAHSNERNAAGDRVPCINTQLTHGHDLISQAHKDRCWDIDHSEVYFFPFVHHCYIVVYFQFNKIIDKIIFILLLLTFFRLLFFFFSLFHLLGMFYFFHIFVAFMSSTTHARQQTQKRS